MPSHQPRRLYLRLYLAFLGVMVAVFALSLGASFLFGRGGLGIFRQGPRFAEHLTRMLPPSHDTEGMARTVLQMHDELGVDVDRVVARDLRHRAVPATEASRADKDKLTSRVRC